MKSPTTSDFKQALRGAGYKATPARLSILQVLQKKAKPVSVPELVDGMKKEKLDPVTAYRTLTTLKEIGLVKQVDFHHGVSYYELSSLGEHHHVVCTNCEKVEDITDCCTTDMEVMAKKKSGFASITNHSLEFFGLCKECSA